MLAQGRSYLDVAILYNSILFAADEGVLGKELLRNFAIAFRENFKILTYVRQMKL